MSSSDWIPYRMDSQLLAQIVEGLPSGITVQEPDGRLCYANAAAAELMGFDGPQAMQSAPPGEILARFDLFHPDGAPMSVSELPGHIALSGQAAPEQLIRLRAKATGQDRWFLFSAKAVLGEDGMAIRVVNVFRDVTLQQRSLAATMKLALASGRMGAWDWHIASARVSWSPELERIHGIAEGSFGGTFEAFQEDIHPEDKERVLATIQGAAVEKRRTDFNLMYRIVRSDGQVRWVESRGQLLFDARGQPERMTGVCTDITERKGAEESAQRLLVEQAARAEAVAAQQELSRSNAELQQFAYVASHDLQEPLRAVASYTQLLAKRYKGRLDADADEFIQFILDGAARMQGLIRDLLSYSRVGTGAKTPAVIPCERPLAAAIANLKVGIEQSGAEISHGPLPAVIGEEGQLVQLFQNLLANAIKFRRGPKPRIRVTAHPREGDWELQVKDDGIGISAEYFDRIFIIFQRLHSQAEYAGNGIGLAICKKIVERHGGKIWIESQPNQGTTFHFTLPSGGV